MKRLSALFLSIAVPAVLLLSAGCSVPHRIVSKEDVTARAWNDPASDKAVLIASRSSEFKDRIVEAVEQGVRRDDVYVKVIGVEELENEDGGTYTAVVLINTCMAWAMDPKIKAFLDRQENTDRVIVLTTSGNGEWTPKKKEMEFDVVTSASEDYDPEAVADGIVNRVNRLLE
jgi:hypothetical protein